MRYFTLVDQQICVEGHYLPPNQHTKMQPYWRCPQCGNEVIKECFCKATIRVRGFTKTVGKWEEDEYLPIPKYCWGRGKPYPWTEKIIKATKALVDELEELNESERNLIMENIEDFIGETPSTVLAATRIKKIIIKAKESTQIALKNFMVEVASMVAQDVLTGRVNY